MFRLKSIPWHGGNYHRIFLFYSKSSFLLLRVKLSSMIITFKSVQ